MCDPTWQVMPCSSEVFFNSVPELMHLTVAVLQKILRTPDRFTVSEADQYHNVHCLLSASYSL